MSASDILTALGAFLSGVGAVLTTLWAIRLILKRAEADCQKRFEAFREGLNWREDHQ